MNDLIVVEKIAGWEKLKALVLDSVLISEWPVIPEAMWRMVSS